MTNNANPDEAKKVDFSESNEAKPAPIKLPPNPSEPVQTAYEDPNAPKPKRKLHWGKVLILSLLVIVLAGGAALAYLKLIKQEPQPSAISDFSGGLGSDVPVKSEVTPETEAAKKFLQAVQTKDATTVNDLSSDDLKKQVILETKDDSMSVLSFYQGKFDGLDFNSFTSLVAETEDATGSSTKKVTFSDTSGQEGSTDAYSVELLIRDENGILRVTSVQINLSF